MSDSGHEDPHEIERFETGEEIQEGTKKCREYAAHSGPFHGSVSYSGASRVF